MQELRFVAVSEDGRYAVLAIPGRSARFTLPIDERLRAVSLGQTSRLAQYEIEVESPLRPKEIQARIRAGETVEEIADAAGIAAERVRWFEGPVLAERAYVADQAQLASVRRQGDATPGPRLGEIVTERLKVFGTDPEDAQWDAKKLGDGSWQVQLIFISGGRLHTAEWIFDQRRRHVLPADDNAARMSLPGAEPPQPAASAPGEATVTHLAPRLSSASGHSAPALGQPGTGTSGFGQGMVGNGATGGRARHERPGSGRPAVPQPQAPQPQVAEPRVAETQHGEPEAPVPREAQAPAAVAPSVPSAPAVSPAAVAAQASREKTRIAQAREETAAVASSNTSDSPTAATPAAAARPAAPVTSAPSPAEAVPSAPAESAGEQAARQGRKTARGKRSSVPSWDEIMFGSSRQRD
ncbi:MAG: septation protein SepH [Streptosporangiaceae bacterium]